MADKLSEAGLHGPLHYSITPVGFTLYHGDTPVWTLITTAELCRLQAALSRAILERITNADRHS